MCEFAALVNRTQLEALLFRSRSWKWTAGALLALFAVGAADYWTGPEITFSVFYLVPVAIAAWLSGPAVAVAGSGLAAVVWLAAEFASSRVDSNVLVYVWNFCARLLFLLLVALLLAQLHRMLLRERELSRTDALTGLLNGRGFREVMEAELARAQRYGHPLSLAFVDIDDFKRVNDVFGHAAGDRLLIRVAMVLRGSLRATDCVARLGGDEFVVLLPVADQAAARAVTSKLAQRIEELSIGEHGQVALSIGVVTCSVDRSGVKADTILAMADRAMYEAKSEGKGSARFTTHGHPAPE